MQWRRVKFQDFYHWREDGEVPDTLFKLRVDGESSAYGVNTPLQVWQSVDQALVLVITTENLTEDRESSRLCRVVVTPSPVFDEGGRAAAVTSLSFEFSQHALSQTLEKWQLLQLVKGQKNVYHLLVNAGTAVHVLVFYARRRRQQVESRTAEARPRGLGVSHFSQSMSKHDYLYEQMWP